jgi:hypothetical protein
MERIMLGHTELLGHLSFISRRRETAGCKRVVGTQNKRTTTQLSDIGAGSG